MFPFYIIPTQSQNERIDPIRIYGDGGGFDLYTFDTRQVFQFMITAAVAYISCCHL